MAEPDQADMPDFLKDRAIGLVASLPCYTEENVRAQRGPGAFETAVSYVEEAQHPRLRPGHGPSLEARL